MPYFHVLIETKNPSEKYYELDKTDLSEIEEEIVIPYVKKEQFTFDGYVLDETKIKRILIKVSDCSSKEYAKLKQEELPPNVIMAILPRDIIESSDYTRNITNRVLMACERQIQEDTSESEAPIVTQPKAPMDKSKVFIVHGHDNAAKEAVARFVEKIGLEAIILHEQASSGNTIIEKIEANSNVGFAIVLYTACDVGASKEEKDQLKPRARQNVVFEHGYLIGKIGRKNVCALVKGNIETPNDISGVVYIKMDESEAWKYHVAKEMKACGYEFDPSKLLE
jgi:putative nucleotide-binding protein containing TIR-like domain